MKGLRVVHILKMTFIGVLALTVIGYAVMWLWNWVIPPIVGWHAIGFAQAIALLVLCRLLFVGFRGRGGHWRRRMHQRWAPLSPEERQRLRDGVHHRCGSHRPPPTDEAASTT
jgi:uncharacterized membrane protein YqjE